MSSDLEERKKQCSIPLGAPCWTWAPCWTLRQYLASRSTGIGDINVATHEFLSLRPPLAGGLTSRPCHVGRGPIRPLILTTVARDLGLSMSRASKKRQSSTKGSKQMDAGDPQTPETVPNNKLVQSSATNGKAMGKTNLVAAPTRSKSQQSWTSWTPRLS